MAFFYALVFTALALLLTGEASAQEWVADVHAGKASYETAPLASESSNVIAGLRFAVDQRFFQVAAAAPLSSGDLFWGAVVGGDRIAFRRGRIELGLDATGQAHGQRDAVAEAPGWGMRGELMPVLSVSVGPLIMEGRSGGSWYRGRMGGTDWSRDLHVTDFALSLPLDPSIRIEGHARHLRPENEAYTFVGGGASAAVGPGGVQASVGSWVSGIEEDESSSTAWALGGSLPVTPATTLWVSARREPFDPHFLGAARTSWGAGISYRLGGGDRSAPPRSGAEHRSGERVVLRLPLSEASSPPMVAGDFTSWEPVRMHRRGDSWRLDLDLKPGLYHYAFRSADGEWFVPESVAHRRDDGMGGWVAVLIVPGGGAP